MQKLRDHFILFGQLRLQTRNLLIAKIDTGLAFIPFERRRALLKQLLLPLVKLSRMDSMLIAQVRYRDLVYEMTLYDRHLLMCVEMTSCLLAHPMILLAMLSILTQHTRISRSD